MRQLLRELDRILRGEATRPEQLRDGTIRIPLGTVSLGIILLGVIYGLCMSVFSIVNREAFEWRLIAAPILKIPALFFLTLAVTYPSLYVFNALVGSRLGLASLVRLIITAMAVTLCVAASFGTIIAFFSFTTQSYSFMVLANVVACGVAGVLGLFFLLQTLNRLSADAAPPATPPPPPPPAPDTNAVDEKDQEKAAPVVAKAPSALDRIEGQALIRNVRAVFRIWVVVFAIVGAQMAWVLRPFIGQPSAPFEWFRARQSNFFESVWGHLVNLFS